MRNPIVAEVELLDKISSLLMRHTKYVAVDYAMTEFGATRVLTVETLDNPGQRITITVMAVDPSISGEIPRLPIAEPRSTAEPSERDGDCTCPPAEPAENDGDATKIRDRALWFGEYR